MMNLSIVLTVYNKEQYLRRAFDALLAQEGTSDGDYEILVVNDGSTDGSSAIIEEIARENKRIRVLSQKNQGLSMARNNGVAVARGEYVWFVDADDTICPTAISELKNATSHNPDIIPIYARTEGKEGVRNAIPLSIKTGKDVLLSNKWQHCGPFYVYRRSFLLKNKLSYYPGIFHEDSELTPRILYYAESVFVVDKILYVVHVSPDSITHTPNPQRAYDNVFVAERLSDFCRQVHEEETRIGYIFRCQIAQLINNAFFLISSLEGEEVCRFNSYVDSKQSVLTALKRAPFKYKIEWVLFKCFPPHYVGVYKFLKRKR